MKGMSRYDESNDKEPEKKGKLSYLLGCPGGLVVLLTAQLFFIFTATFYFFYYLFVMYLVALAIAIFALIKGEKQFANGLFTSIGFGILLTAACYGQLAYM